jgi:hypothetical protein
MGEKIVVPRRIIALLQAKKGNTGTNWGYGCVCPVYSSFYELSAIMNPARKAAP